MMAFINRCVRAPLTYVADLRAISFKQYLLISTNFSPSYPVMIFTSLGFTLMYCAILIYFIFTSTYSQSCFAGVHGAAYVIAILYPIESILCFVCLTGSIALSKSSCWRVVLMLLFGPILCGFGFGEVGIIQLCLLSGNHHVFPMPSVISKPGFVDTMVYLYLSFIVLYFILVPSINYLYRRQNEAKIVAQASKIEGGKGAQVEGQKKQSEGGSSCCQKITTVFYYICNILFVIAVIFIIVIKLAGPVLFTFIWIKIGTNLNDFTQPMEQFMFAGLILAYFAPLASMFVALGIQRVVKLGRGKKDGQNKDGKDHETSARSSWQPNVELENSARSQKMTESRRSSKLSQKSKPSPSVAGEKVNPSQEQKNQNRAGLL